MQDFADKTAVVTGAASGIGLELAMIFAEQGMNVVLADIENKKLEEALLEVRAAGAAAIAVVTDVGDSESVKALLNAALENFGEVHVLCNNAGVYTGGMLWEHTEDDYEWLIRVNQWGIIHGIRHFVPQMISQGNDCHVVNTSSMAGLCTLPVAGIYHMTKHAALALSECLHLDLEMCAPQVKVSCLCPEQVDTQIARSYRNRPSELSVENKTSMHELAHTAIVDATRGSTPPRVLAERVLQAIKDEQFYVLPPREDPWSDVVEHRLDDIRLRRNPVLTAPDI
ncbi:MAG: SDR family NAD(P)-dependent oxidoreductase [Halioglobus sp.]